MPQRTKLLYMLQQVDSQLMSRKRRYRQVQTQMDEDQELKQARSAMQAANSALTAQRGQLRDHELEAAGVTQKLQETEKRLYSGQVTNPKELTDLQHESEYLKRRRDTLEETQIEEMMRVDQLSEAAEEATQTYEAIETEWRAENAELHDEYDVLRAEMTKLLTQRKALLKHLSEDDLAEYNALRRLRKGVAIVAVKDGSCRVCHVQVPQRDLERAQESDDLFYYCSGCERILYVPQD